MLGVTASEVAVRIAKPGFPGFRIPQVEHRPAAGLGFEMVPNQLAFTAAERVTINAHGLRGPEIRDRDADSDLRVLCLGDSVTFGYGVGDDVPFPRQLDRLLQRAWPDRKFEVINAGVQRYFTYQEIDYLRLKGLRLRPDVVILAVYSNDLGVRPQGNYSEGYEREREQVAGAFRTRFPRLYTLTKNSAVIELMRGAYLSAQGGSAGLRMFEGVVSEREESRWAAMEQDLAMFRDSAQQHNFLPIVIAIPARIQVQKEFPNSVYPKRLLLLTQRLGLESLNLEEVFSKSLEGGVDPYLPWDNHLSSAGHALVAAHIAERLTRLLPFSERTRRSAE